MPLAPEAGPVAFIAPQLLLVFVFFTAPVTSHALMQAAHVAGLAPWKRPARSCPTWSAPAST